MSMIYTLSMCSKYHAKYSCAHSHTSLIKNTIQKITVAVKEELFILTFVDRV